MEEEEREKREEQERQQRNQQHQAGNISPLTDDGSQHQEKRRRPRSGDGVDEGAGGDDRNPPPPTTPPPTPPPGLNTPPAVSAPTNLNTTNIPQTIFHVMDPRTIRQWINEHHAHQAANMNTRASSQLGQNALATMAAIFSSHQCRELWPVGEEPRMLFPNMLTIDNMKVRALIDANTEELFRILQERYPEKEADSSNCLMTACNTFIPLNGLPTHSILDLWGGTISNLFMSGKFTIDNQMQIIACHRAHALRNRSPWAQRVFRLIFTSEHVFKDDPNPLGAYIQKVIRYLSLEIDNIRKMTDLGYTVDIVGAQKPATTNNNKKFLGNQKGKGTVKVTPRTPNRPIRKIQPQSPIAACSVETIRKHRQGST